MMNPRWIFRLLSEKHSLAAARCIAGGIAVAILGLTAGTAVAQIPIFVSNQAPPDGYTLHESIDLGGHVANIDGSGAMYDTLVNQQSGPRIMGETFELRALPNTKNTLVDYLKAFTTGLGGDPYNVAKLDFSKGKLYEFSGLFRRDRQYFDYNLLGNPNLPPGQSIPIGPAAAPTGSYAWPQVTESPFMFNTVRRMTDTKLTLLPLSKVTFRVGYSQNVFLGPSLSPSGYFIGGYNDVLLQEYQRNSTDDWTGSVEWKPVQRTRLTYEEQITHYKGDSSFSMAPQYFNLQEANGSRVAVLQSYDNPINSPVGITCNAGVGPASISPARTPNGLPIVDPACNVITSYSRSRANPRNLPDRNLPATKLQHQKRYDERQRSLHQREHEPAELLRRLPRSGGNEPRNHVCRQRPRQAGSDRLRLRRHLAGAEKAQHLRADRLLECAPAGSCQHYESNHRDFRNPEHQ